MSPMFTKHIKFYLTFIAVLWCTITARAYDFEQNGICYNITSSDFRTVEVAKGAYSGEVVIPAAVNNWGVAYDVTAIGDEAFYGCTSLTSVTIPNSVTSIGEYAFLFCSSLVNVEIPKSVTSLGRGAFHSCESITSIEIPNGITILPQALFGSCSNLRYVKLPNSIVSLGEGFDENDDIVPEGVFCNCINLASIEIPNGVKYIGKGAFIGSGLLNVEIPNSVESIGQQTFLACTNLENLTIGSGVRNLGSYILDGCTNIKSITSLISAENLFEIKSWYLSSQLDFETCVLYVPSGAKSTYMATNGWKEFSSIVEIGHEYNEGKCGDNAYWRLDYKTRTLTISGSGRMYDYQNGTSPWFNEKEKIENIEILSGITEIGSYAFFEHDNLISITLPQSVTRIGDVTFGFCDALTSIAIPNGVLYIGVCAFYNCTNLNSISIPEDVMIVGNAAFGNTAWYDNLPNGLVYVGRVLYCYKGTMPKKTSIQVREGTVSISGSAFNGCSGLSFISLPQSLKEIGENAFWGCSSLTSITIPESVTSVGGGVFTECSSLTSITCFVPIPPENFYIYDEASRISLYVPQSSIEKYIADSYWSGFKSITPIMYNLTYMVDGKKYKTESVPYGSSLATIDAPTKEGYTFSGFGNLPATMPANDVTVNAYFTINQYRVTFIVDGIELESQLLDYGSTIKAPNVSDREGYTFSGWSEMPATVPAKNITISGTFTANKYNLTYMVDGAVYKTLAMTYGSTITPLALPAKEGHAFSGWSNIPATMPAKDVTVSGSFTVNNYTLTYMVDGDIYKTESIAYGGSITMLAAPTKEGYTFSGWSKIPAIMPANNVTITGNFTINSYTLTYMVDGQFYKVETIAYGSAITPLTIPEKEGYSFSGWDEVPATMPARNVVVKGNFSVNKYTLTYVLDEEIYKTESIAYGTPISLLASPQKEGYTFSGWSESPTTMPAKDVVINGKFNINSYTLTYIVDGEVYKTETIVYGASITPLANPTKDGFTFSGWSKVPTTMPSMNVTIHGSFTTNTYVLTYMVDDAIYQTVPMVYGSPITALADPVLEGHTFSGWSEIPATMPAENVTITGSFTINSYALTYIVDGKEYKTETVVYGTELTALAALTKEGYTFSGWSEIPATMPAENVTITGTFTINKYRVVFALDGIVKKMEVLEYGTMIVAPSFPDKEGYTLTWSEEIPATVPAKDVYCNAIYVANIYQVYYFVGANLVHTADVPYGEKIPEYIYEPKEGEGEFLYWTGDDYETMPAHEVYFTAVLGERDTNIENSEIRNENSEIIYDLQGRKVIDSENLKGGVYIINGRKVVIK